MAGQGGRSEQRPVGQDGHSRQEATPGEGWWELEGLLDTGLDFFGCQRPRQMDCLGAWYPRDHGKGTVKGPDTPETKADGLSGA